MASVTTATIKSTSDATTEPDTETTEATGGDTALDNTATTVAAKVDTTADAADATQVDADATTTDTDTKSAETDATTTATTSSPNANMVTSATVSQVGPTEGKVQQLGDTYHTCESQGTNACETAIQQHTTAVIFGGESTLIESTDDNVSTWATSRSRTALCFPIQMVAKS